MAPSRKKTDDGGPVLCMLCGRPIGQADAYYYDKQSDEYVCDNCAFHMKSMWDDVCDQVLGSAASGAAAKPRARSARTTRASGSTISAKKLPAPREIKAFLDQYVIGQDEAKKSLAVAGHNHYRRIFGAANDQLLDESLRDVELEKQLLDIASFWLLGCNMDPEAARVSCEGILHLH